MRSEEHPCRRDCKNRSGGCHAVCEEYLAYERKKLRRYEAAQRTKDSMEATDGAMRRIRAGAREKQKGRRHYGG